MRTLHARMGYGRRGLASKGRCVRAWARDEQGSVLLETVLGISMVFLLVYAIVEFSMMAYTYSVYADAARAGVRYAVVHGSDNTNCSGPSSGCTDSTGSNVSAVVSSSASNLTSAATAVVISVTYPDSAATPGSRVQVTVTYTYKPLFKLAGVNPGFTTTSIGRIVF